MKTIFEEKHFIKIVQFFSIGKFTSIERNKKDLFFMDEEFTFFLVKPDSKYYQELFERSQQ